MKVKNHFWDGIEKASVECNYCHHAETVEINAELETAEEGCQVCDLGILSAKDSPNE